MDPPGFPPGPAGSSFARPMGAFQGLLKLFYTLGLRDKLSFLFAGLVLETGPTSSSSATRSRRPTPTSYQIVDPQWCEDPPLSRTPQLGGIHGSSDEGQTTG
jgi:hypothetical protein